jgi:hypothetical protein
MIVPFGEGFCIINEELFVTNATDEQRKVRICLKQIVISLLWNSGVTEHQEFYSYISQRKIVLKKPVWKGDTTVTVTISSLQATQIITKYGPHYLFTGLAQHSHAADSFVYTT